MHRLRETMKNKMDIKKITLWVVIGVLAVVALYVVFFRGTGIGHMAVKSAGQAAKTGYSGMVGTC